MICERKHQWIGAFRALMSQGENVHISSLRLASRTHPAGQPASDLEASIRLRAGARAFEGKLFNIVSSELSHPDVIDVLARGNSVVHRKYRRGLPQRASMILASRRCADQRCVIRDEEGIVYGEIDVAKCVSA